VARPTHERRWRLAGATADEAARSPGSDGVLARSGPPPSPGWGGRASPGRSYLGNSPGRRCQPVGLARLLSGTRDAPQAGRV